MFFNGSCFYATPLYLIDISFCSSTIYALFLGDCYASTDRHMVYVSHLDGRWIDFLSRPVYPLRHSLIPATMTLLQKHILYRVAEAPVKYFLKQSLLYNILQLSVCCRFFSATVEFFLQQKSCCRFFFAVFTFLQHMCCCGNKFSSSASCECSASSVREGKMCEHTGHVSCA